VTREVKRWSHQIVADHRNTMTDVDWFRSSFSDVSEFTDVVTSFIAALTDTIDPRLKVDGSIRNALNTRTSAYNSGLISGHMDEYKAASYGLW